MNGILLTSSRSAYWVAIMIVGSVLALGYRRLLRGRPGPSPTALIPIATVVIVWVHWSGVSMGSWVAGATAGFSVPFLVLMANATKVAFGERGFLGRRDLRDLGRVGLVLGLLLYPAALGWGSWDPYALGWNSPLLVWLVAGWTLHLLRQGSRTGWILTAALGFWLLESLWGAGQGLGDSRNLWWYLVDPFLVLVSIPLAFLRVPSETPSSPQA